MRLSLLSILLFFSVSAAGQSYYVISVNGTVMADNVQLKPKDKIAENAQLQFSSLEDELRIISPEKSGFFLLRAQNIPRNAYDEFLIAFKEALLPATQYVSTASRGRCDYTYQTLIDLKAFFRKDIIIWDTSYYQVGTENFLLDQDHFFEIEQEVAGKSVVQKLPFSDQRFLIPSEILGQGTNQATLFFRDGEVDRVRIGKFRVVRLDQKRVMEELRVLRDMDDAPGGEFLCRSALPYLDMYGRSNPAQVKDLLAHKLDLVFE